MCRRYLNILWETWLQRWKTYKVFKLEFSFSHSLIVKTDPFISVETLLSAELSTRLKTENLRKLPRGHHSGDPVPGVEMCVIVQLWNCTNGDWGCGSVFRVPAGHAQSPGGWPLALHKPVIVAHACHPSTQDAEEGKKIKSSKSSLPNSEFEASWATWHLPSERKKSANGSRTLKQEWYPRSRSKNVTEIGAR